MRFNALRAMAHPHWGVPTEKPFTAILSARMGSRWLPGPHCTREMSVAPWLPHAAVRRAASAASRCGGTAKSILNQNF